MYSKPVPMTNANTLLYFPRCDHVAFGRGDDVARFYHIAIDLERRGDRAKPVVLLVIDQNPQGWLLATVGTHSRAADVARDWCHQLGLRRLIDVRPEGGRWAATRLAHMYKPPIGFRDAIPDPLKGYRPADPAAAFM